MFILLLLYHYFCVFKWIVHRLFQYAYVAQSIGSLNSMKYIIEVLRIVYKKGSRITDLYPQFLALFGLAIFFNFWAILSYKKVKS